MRRNPGWHLAERLKERAHGRAVDGRRRSAACRGLVRHDDPNGNGCPFPCKAFVETEHEAHMGSGDCPVEQGTMFALRAEAVRHYRDDTTAGSKRGERGDEMTVGGEGIFFTCDIAGERRVHDYD